jgi:hypothetical protein
MTVESLLSKDKYDILDVLDASSFSIACPCDSEEISNLIDIFYRKMKLRGVFLASRGEMKKSMDNFNDCLEVSDMGLKETAQYIIDEISHDKRILINTLPEEIQKIYSNMKYDHTNKEIRETVSEEIEKLNQTQLLNIQNLFIEFYLDDLVMAKKRSDNVYSRKGGLKTLSEIFNSGFDLADRISCKDHDRSSIKSVVTNIPEWRTMPAVLMICETEHSSDIKMKKFKEKSERGEKLRNQDILEFNLSQAAIRDYKILGYVCGCGHYERKGPNIVKFWTDSKFDEVHLTPAYACRNCLSTIAISRFSSRGTVSLYDPNLMDLIQNIEIES